MEHDIPDLSEDKINESFRKLECIDLESVSEIEIEEILSHLFRGFTMQVPEFEPGMDIIRGRIVEKKPTYFKEITYPEKKFVKKYGRANLIDQSMFYGSTAKTAPFAEIGANVGDLVVISHWRTMSKMAVMHIGFTDYNAKRLESSRKLEDLYDFVKETQNRSILNNQVYEFLGKLFSEEVNKDKEHLYRLTSAIANKFLTSPVHGILYPTIAMYGNVDNLVLKPDYVDGNLKLLYTEFLQIVKKDKAQYSTRLIDTAVEVNDSGEILWTGKNLGWNLLPQQELSIKEKGQIYYANDIKGDSVVPVPTTSIEENLTQQYQNFLDSFSSNFKYNVDVNVSNLFEDYIAKCTLNFDFEKKAKFITIYIPICPNPEAIANIILSKRDTYFTEAEGFEITIIDEIESTSLKAIDLGFNGEIYIYSETQLSIGNLDPYESFGLKVSIMPT
jgi:hypothetical protein